MSILTQRNAVMFCMGLAILFGAFSPIVPGFLTPYFAAASASATSLAGLFLHPPALPGDPAAPKPTATPVVAATTGVPPAA